MHIDESMRKEKSFIRTLEPQNRYSVGIMCRTTRCYTMITTILWAQGKKFLQCDNNTAHFVDCVGDLILISFNEFV